MAAMAATPFASNRASLYPTASHAPTHRATTVRAARTDAFFIGVESRQGWLLWAPMRRSVLAVGAAVVILGPTALAFFSGGYFGPARVIAGIATWVLVILVAGVAPHPLGVQRSVSPAHGSSRST